MQLTGLLSKNNHRSFPDRGKHGGVAFARNRVLMEKGIPYQDLYVYEVSGEISDSKTFFKEDFIGCWNEGEISCLFFSAPHDHEVQAFIQKRRFGLLLRNVMDYKAWQAGEELKPFTVGNLVIAPPWETCEVDPEHILVHLDPCVVFGTGYHPTTRSWLGVRTG